jgi:Ca-activated chloride channel family protein
MLGLVMVGMICWWKEGIPSPFPLFPPLHATISPLFASILYKIYLYMHLNKKIMRRFITFLTCLIVLSCCGIEGDHYLDSASTPYYDYDSMNRESYREFEENDFLSPYEHPLSTFAVDVDVASYANVRRMINQGGLPPKDAVRIEEMVNYFSYAYPQPEGSDPVRISTEIGFSPWNSQNRLLKIGLKAKEIPAENLPFSNFVFLIDASGSMLGHGRLDLVKASLKLLLNNLRDKDRVAIVAYAGAAGEVLPSTPANDKQKILDALYALSAGGSTAGGAGIQLAYKIAEKNFIPNGNNRVILCTDGDFNVGISSNGDLEKLIAERRKTGIFLSVLGYGMGNYKDDKLQTLAQAGNGNHAYIDNLQEANRVLVNEFGSTMYAVAKDVKLQIEFNPALVQAYRLVGYETRLLNDEDFDDDDVDAGEMGAGHTVTAFYEIVPAGVNSNVFDAENVDPKKYQRPADSETDIVATNNLLHIRLRYKPIDSDVSKKIEQFVVDNGGGTVSDDFRFASSVVMMGMLLRDSKYKVEATYDKAIEAANRGLGNDPLGYRREFVRIAEAAKGITKVE